MSHLLGKPWRYINEGNLHIVVEVVGTNYVIRLIKETSNKIDFDHVGNAVNFVNIVMIPILHNRIYAHEEIVEIPTDELETLIVDLQDLRPAHRRHKAILSSYAIKSLNLCMISYEIAVNYCVEIKPKEGLMAECFDRISKCYYCLKQYLKLQEGQISKVSSYCPLDLFSGDRSRMKKALSSLVNNPQNNFKLFLNGRIIYHEKLDTNDFDSIIENMSIFNSPNNFFDFIIEILLSKQTDSNIVLQETQATSTRSNQCVESDGLEHNTYLHNLLRTQKLSKYFNIDAFYLNPDEDRAARIVTEINTNGLNLNTTKDFDKFIATTHPVNLALISAVAKDASIMISFSTNPVYDLPTIQIGDHRIPYKVAITDLEPKTVKTLIKREKTEKQLIMIIQPHSETKAKQLEAWQHLISDYMKTNKLSTIDIRESQNSPLFNNTTINRKLSQDAILVILEDMAKNGRAAAIDKSKNVWEVYWHSLDEWGNMVYSWANDNGLNNSVCTLFELREGDNTAGEEFHGLDMGILLKALRALEAKGKCELMDFEDSQGVKFF